MPRLPARTALAAALALALAGGVRAAPMLISAVPPSVNAIDAARGDPNLIILRAGVFDPLVQTLDARAVGAATPATTDYAIVQFQPGKLAARKSLAAQGVEFLGYVPNNAYFVRLNGMSLEQANRAVGVRWAGALQPALKLDPTLWQGRRLASAARQWDGRYEIQLDAFAGASPERISAALIKSVPGVIITDRSERAGAGQYVRAAIAADALDTLLAAATAIDGVEFVSPWIQPRPSNSGAIGAIQGNATSACSGSGTPCGPTPIWDHGIFGSGQIIAISDTGTDANEAWFTTLDKGAGPHTEITFADSPAPTLPAIGTLYPDNKIIGYWVQPGATAYDNNADCENSGNPSSYHGTHTSGTLVGDAAGAFGTASTPTSAGHNLADGMAPNAQLLQQDIGNDLSGCLSIKDLRGTLKQAVAADAHIHSDSWGAKNSGTYDSNDNNVDYATNTLEDLLVVIAAGNQGSGASTIGSPGNAKNALTVGALGHAGNTTVAYFSSRGPTADGRLKPDIMAPGDSTVSALGDANTNGSIEAPLTRTLSGTSMATPTIAGNAALMRQFFADGFYPRGVKTAADDYNPSGMALKAFLLNGTNVLQSASWPSNTFGWGRAWLDGNLWFANTLIGGNDTRRSRLFERTNAAGLETGESNQYTIANVAAGAEFRATLTWFDPEASPGAASTLVNNLDLEVVGPGGTYLGNVFSSGVSTTGGSADNKNTVEQVRLTAPTAGSYTLRVKAASIPGNGRSQTDRQGYALVVSGKFGLPDAAAFAAPNGLSIASNDANGIAVAFTAPGGSQGFQLYRANGTCAAAKAGDFRMVANGATSPLIDDRTNGGYSYAYRVRGISNDVEGNVSACVDAVSLGSCTLQPDFDVGSLTADSANSSCSIALAWSPAQLMCPASSGITYTVQRSMSPDFTAAITLATGLTSAAFTDNGLIDGTPYYYKVAAQDSFGNAAPVSLAFNATPSGSDGPDPGNFTDDVDTHSYLALEAPWQITGTSFSNGSYSYHNAPDAQVYPDLTCASIATPPLTVPAGSTLSFRARYNMEYQWDGVVMEISTDNGNTWQDLPPDGGYPNTFAMTGENPVANACDYPATHGAFTGVSTKTSYSDPNNGSAVALFKPFSKDLSAFVGQTVQIRWRMSSDPNTAYLGFLLDEVNIGNGVIFADGFEGGATFKDYTCH